MRKRVELLVGLMLLSFLAVCLVTFVSLDRKLDRLVAEGANDGSSADGAVRIDISQGAPTSSIGSGTVSVTIVPRVEESVS